MEGPTPVSALLHAATMVTAGIYLIIRMSYIVEMSSIGLKIFIILLGAITALFGGIVASFQFDIKKVIAYSTCSQLGYMVYGCGISSYDMSMFHLVNHGFFKALLFLSAGVIIHGMQGEQDIRKMGGLIKIYPFTYRMMMIGVFALMGLPFMSGFYSKELIIKMGRSVCNNIYDINDIYKYIIFSYYILMCSIIMTGYYNIRMINLTYLGIIRNTKRIIINGGENSNYLGIPLIMLCILSIFSGYILEDIMVGWGTNYWNNSLYLLDNYYKGINFTNMNYIKILSKLNVTIIPLINLIIGIFIYMVSKIIYEKYIKQIKNNLKILNIIEIIYMYFNKGMMFDKIYNNYIVKPILYINNKIYKNIEQGIFELIGLVGIKILILNISKEISKGKSGYISDYIYINIIILLLGLIILKLYILKIVLYIIILIIIQLNNKKRND
jgi:NADH-ubiquinone oxidoreductase chain 5